VSAAKAKTTRKPKGKLPTKPATAATATTDPAPERSGSHRSRPVRWLIGRFAPELGHLDLFPLAILFALNLVDEFDIAALGILGPNIRDAFGLTNAELGTLRAWPALVGLAIPFVGWLGDRSKRVRMAWVGAIVWGLFGFATGLATVVGVLVLFRFGSGTAKLVSGSVHPSLLTDYYPAQVRGRVFSLHRSADAWAAMLGPALAGLIAWQLGWRYAFFILAIPTFFFAYLALRMKEPVRGITDDAQAAMQAIEEPAIPFGRAIRWLYSVPTMKRIFVGSFFTGLGAVSFAIYSSVFLDDVFGVSELGRGVIASAIAPMALVSVYVGGRVTDRLVRTKTMADVTKFFGYSVTAIGLGLAVYAWAPNLPSAIGIALVVTFFGALWAPAYLTIVGLVSPARIRTLGFSYAGFFLTLGIIAVPFIGAIADGPGIRWALFVSAIILAIGGLVHASAAKFANADVNRSLQVLQTEVRLRNQRLEKGEQSLLTVQSIDFAYEDTQVLFGVDFDVQQGELVALLGTNGAGKSTLLKVVSGLEHPRHGAIFFDGRDITHLEPEETAKLGIVLMPGGKSIFPTLTVRENLELASWLYNDDREWIESSRKRLFEIFPILGGRLDQQAGSLSGGEQQMLSLGQAFISKPKLLMIDELSLGLAPVIVQQLLRIVEDIHASGTTVVLVEQSVNVALTVAKHAYFMEKGEIRFNGSTSELLQRRDILRSVFLEGAGSVLSRGKKR
jgi:ABC-type branched-subunit amino acid transport system ATPase component/predicted MFS family arabinose efflux permease